jgi:hypothetical protein
VTGAFPTHDRGVSPSEHSAADPWSGADASMTGHLFTGLERFWPSRRGHAFDELCR